MNKDASVVHSVAVLYFIIDGEWPARPTWQGGRTVRLAVPVRPRRPGGSATSPAHPYPAAIQMLWFAVNPYPSLPFAVMPLGRSILAVLQPLTFLPTPPGSTAGVEYAAQTLVIVAAAWVAANLSLFVFAVYTNFKDDDFINGM